MKNLEAFFKETDLSYLEIGKTLEEHFLEIWDDVYKPSQEIKAVQNNISEDAKNLAFNGLSKRGKFLCQLYDFFECDNIAEVGTAEGFQFFTFCRHLSMSNKKSKVYTCDIRDVRNSKYVNKFPENEVFTLGTSKEMSEKIITDGKKIDMYWIDGAHENSNVLYDVIRLAKTQSNKSIWIFDDFNERFGAYREIQWLSNFNETRSLTLGPTASGKPNNMLILQGGF